MSSNSFARCSTASCSDLICCFRFSTSSSSRPWTSALELLVSSTSCLASTVYLSRLRFNCTLDPRASSWPRRYSTRSISPSSASSVASNITSALRRSSSWVNLARSLWRASILTLSSCICSSVSSRIFLISAMALASWPSRSTNLATYSQNCAPPGPCRSTFFATSPWMAVFRRRVVLPSSNSVSWVLMLMYVGPVSGWYSLRISARSAGSTFSSYRCTAAS
mmetsp:Transcript_19602/g.34782  ORF Transcript_19602/g.34782 Transcript_19602/m.34782 type:complete len:222 (-) Transcript_19602:994-1659(-)